MTTPVFKDYAAFGVTNAALQPDDRAIDVNPSDGARLPSIPQGTHAHFSLKYFLKAGSTYPTDDDDVNERISLKLQSWELRKATGTSTNRIELPEDSLVDSSYGLGVTQETWEVPSDLEAHLAVVATFVVASPDLKLLTLDWGGLEIKGGDDCRVGTSSDPIPTVEANDARLRHRLLLGEHDGIGGQLRFQGGQFSLLTEGGSRDNTNITASTALGNDVYLRKGADGEKNTGTDADKQTLAFLSEIVENSVTGNKVVSPAQDVSGTYPPVGGPHGDALWVQDAGGGNARVIAGDPDHLDDVINFSADGSAASLTVGGIEATAWQDMAVVRKSALENGFSDVVLTLPQGQDVAGLRNALANSTLPIAAGGFGAANSGVVVAGRFFAADPREPLAVVSASRPTDSAVSAEAAALGTGALWRRQADGAETAVFRKQADGTWRRRRTPGRILTSPGYNRINVSNIAFSAMDGHDADFDPRDHDMFSFSLYNERDASGYKTEDTIYIDGTAYLGDNQDISGFINIRATIDLANERVALAISGSREPVTYRVKMICHARADED